MENGSSKDGWSKIRCEELLCVWHNDRFIVHCCSQLECSEELGDSMHEHDVSLALAIYKRAHIHHKAVKCLAEIGHSNDIQKYARDVRFDPDHDVFPQMVNASAGEYAGRGHVNGSLEASRNLAFPAISLGEDDVEWRTIKTVQESQDAQPRTAWTDVKQLRTLDFPALRDAFAGVATIEYLRVRGLALRGEDAAIFSDLLQQVRPIGHLKMRGF